MCINLLCIFAIICSYSCFVNIILLLDEKCVAVFMWMLTFQWHCIFLYTYFIGWNYAFFFFFFIFDYLFIRNYFIFGLWHLFIYLRDYTMQVADNCQPFLLQSGDTSLQIYINTRFLLFVLLLSLFFFRFTDSSPRLRLDSRIGSSVLFLCNIIDFGQYHTCVWFSSLGWSTPSSENQIRKSWIYTG